jgi:glycosyltransferase involved in cell wall biosynthesis
MKILFFIESLRSGGKERRLSELMNVLRNSKDIQFELAVMNDDFHYNDVHNFGINIHYIIRKTKKDISVFFSFYNLCKSFNPEIVHCWDSMSTIYSIPTCKLLRIKLINGMIFNVPNNMSILNKTGFRARVTFPFSDMIIGNSLSGIAAYHAPLSKTICIYNGFNFDRTKEIIAKDVLRRRLEIDSQFIIGMVATFAENKDYETYFSAAQLLLGKRDDITFLAIGEHTDSFAAKGLIPSDLIHRFRFVGKMREIESFISIMDICVLTTFTEGISNSIMEYMALGKPVIATDGGGTKEILLDRKTGFLISPSSPDELAAKIELLLENEELRITMGNAGLSRIKSCFSIDKMVSEYILTYKSSLLM